MTPTGGTLCRARHDSWGTSVEPVVTQLDGAPLGALSAVEAGPDGKVYFAAAAETSVKNGLEGALRTELLAHTGTGWVYVYDPADRSVQRVLGGIAGASGLALSEDGRTLYVSDLGSRCVWAVDADARELTAGGRTAKASFPACRATPAHWRWTRTASSTSATAGRAATGWKRTRTAPCCGASPCGPVKICSRSCSACRRTRPALRRWIRRTAAGSGPSRAGRWTAAPQSARRAAKCISVRQALPACCRQECKRGVFL
ncbi:MAG: SMP-30/gluconolactonase/LRE family protein [Faecalibacterium sp.]